jgi:hypothetical protein
MTFSLRPIQRLGVLGYEGLVWYGTKVTIFEEMCCLYLQDRRNPVDEGRNVGTYLPDMVSHAR